MIFLSPSNISSEERLVQCKPFLITLSDAYAEVLENEQGWMSPLYVCPTLPCPESNRDFFNTEASIMADTFDFIRQRCLPSLAFSLMKISRLTQNLEMSRSLVELLACPSNNPSNRWSLLSAFTSRQLISIISRAIRDLVHEADLNKYQLF
jgi:hypothetical protein